MTLGNDIYKEKIIRSLPHLWNTSYKDLQHMNNVKLYWPKSGSVTF